MKIMVLFLIFLPTVTLGSIGVLTCDFGKDEHAVIVLNKNANAITGYYKGLGDQFDLLTTDSTEVQLKGIKGIEFRVGLKSQHVDAPFRLRVYRNGEAHLLADMLYQMDLGINCSVSPSSMKKVVID